MRSNPDGTFDLDINWQSVDDHGSKQLQNLSVEFVDLVLEYVEKLEREFNRESELDTSSSASRQHYIDTGEYLRKGEEL